MSNTLNTKEEIGWEEVRKMVYELALSTAERFQDDYPNTPIIELMDNLKDGILNIVSPLKEKNKRLKEDKESLLKVIHGHECTIVELTEENKRLKEGIEVFLNWLEKKRPTVAGLGAPVIMLKELLRGEHLLLNMPGESSKKDEEAIALSVVDFLYNLGVIKDENLNYTSSGSNPMKYTFKKLAQLYKQETSK
jgi:hypothetical protein